MYCAGARKRIQTRGQHRHEPHQRDDEHRALPDDGAADDADRRGVGLARRHAVARSPSSTSARSTTRSPRCRACSSRSSSCSWASSSAASSSRCTCRSSSSARSSERRARGRDHARARRDAPRLTPTFARPRLRRAATSARRMPRLPARLADARRIADVAVARCVVGLCVGSFLNVVIHRLPKMLERGWQRAMRRAPRRDARPQQPALQPRRAAFARAPRAATRSRALREHSRRLAGSCSRGKCARARRRSRPAIRSSRSLGGAARRVRDLALRRDAARRSPPACSLWTLLALTLIDFDTQLLPDDLTLPLLWAGLIANLLGPVRAAARRGDRRGRRLPVAVDRSTGCSS